MTRAARLWADVAVVVLCAVAFGPGMAAGLTLYDDSLYLYMNTDALGRVGLSGLLHQWDGTRAWSGQFVEFFPLRDSVYWALYQGWGLWGPAYHLACLAAHVVASLLLIRLGEALGLSARVAVVAAVLFAVHPVHIESVEWAAGLKDPMYSAFMFAAVLAYLKYRAHPRPALYALALLACVGGLLVKSMMISLPLILVALERLIGKPTPWRLIITRVAGFGAVCAVFLVQFILIGKANHAVTPPHGGGWRGHVVLSMWAQVKYLKQAFVPSTFRLIYCFEPPTGWDDWRLWVAVATAVVVGAALWAARRQPLILFAAAWYVACLLPVSNLVPFPAVMADRYLYAAVYGTCLVVALGLEQLSNRLRTPTVVLVCAGLTVTSALRSALWLDQENLWKETDEDPVCLVDEAPAAADAHLLHYWTAKDRREALLAIERSLVTPGVQNSVHLCQTLESGAHQAAALGFPERGEQWARMSVTLCGENPNTWMAVFATTKHRKPRIALAAVERAYRLSRSARALVMVGAARVELGDESGAATALEAVKQSRALACQPLLQWAEEAPAQAPRLAEAVEWCHRPEEPDAR